MNPRLSKKIMRPDFQGEFTASILAAAASPPPIFFGGGPGEAGPFRGRGGGQGNAQSS